MSDILDELLKSVRKFSLEKIEPFAASDDETQTFRREIFTGLAELGVTGLPIETEYDGAGLGYIHLCAVLEEIAKYSVAHAVTLSVSTMVQGIISKFGNEKQKKDYLPQLARGEEIGAFALTEPSSGSDAAALKTTAKKSEHGYLLNGTKMFITSAGLAKTYIVMARTGGEGAKGISAFLVRDGMKGFSIGKAEHKMGWRASPTREIIFENCLVPKENLIGKEGEGFSIAMAALDRGRITIGAIAVGLSKRALSEAIKFSLWRKQFNQDIFEFQGLQFLLADLAVEVESSRLLVEHSALLFDSNKNDQKLASMAKLKSTDTAMRVTTDALQVFGGVGYTTEYPMERLMRDAKVLQIVEGTNQIQRVVIARQLRKEFQQG